MYKDLLEFIVKNLVSNPESVKITEKDQENKLVLTLTVDPSDMGRVIGKEGRIILSIREIINSYGMKNHQKVSVEVEESKSKENTNE